MKVTELRFENVRKSYRTVSLAYVGQVRVGHIGWCHLPARLKTPGAYRAFKGETAIGEFDTKHQAKKALAAAL